MPPGFGVCCLLCRVLVLEPCLVRGSCQGLCPESPDKAHPKGLEENNNSSWELRYLSRFEGL